jgi:hypothetical protein
LVVAPLDDPLFFPRPPATQGEAKTADLVVAARSRFASSMMADARRLSLFLCLE